MVADPFHFKPEQRAAFARALEATKNYDVYCDFPVLSELVSRSYSPTCILVTGAAGFIASHVAIRLTQLYPQYRIIGLDKMSYASDEANLASLRECRNFRFVKGDICDYDLLLQLMREEKVDTVMHFAAQSHVDLSFKERGPMQFVIDNALGTASLLEVSQKCSIRRFVHCSTDEVYGEGSLSNRVMFDEASPLRPNNPYSASKAAADLLVQSFAKSFGFPVVITRGNNCYGPHQFYEKVIPKFVAQLKMGRQITIHGGGTNTRNFLHVQDTASAFDAVLHCGELGEIYNVGGKHEKSTLDVAASVLLAMGLDHRREELVQYVADRAHNDACYPITCAKLHALGWRERHSWEFGIVQTTSYYLQKLETEGRDLMGVLAAHPTHKATDGMLSSRL